ncbi:MAG: hypothetical protein RBT71_10470 [Flavobacteriales bacterium]|jgi:hypothetical protein|nr:hypothetical protein [Flavobacteriales bacterium]
MQKQQGATQAAWPYELERQDDVLRIAFRGAQQVGSAQMKEILRQLAALDPGAQAAVLLDCPAGISVADDTRALLARACRSACRPVAITTPELDLRLQAQVFKVVHRPVFPVRVFASHAEALQWARSRPGTGGC